MTDVCLVFFRHGACDLRGAAQSLEDNGLTVTDLHDHLVVTQDEDDAPRFRVRLADGPHVAVEAAEIAAGTEHEAAMAGCTARFEIEIDDLDEALDEINTLIEVQGSLQDLSQGFLYVPWSGALAAPWDASGEA